MSWFARITGFPEGAYAETQARLRVENGRLLPEGGGPGHAVGELELVPLGALRDRARDVTVPGRLTLGIVGVGHIGKRLAKMCGQGLDMRVLGHQRADLVVTTLFLDCAGGELERRFNETRRRHPMADGRPVMEGIAAERELLEPLRRWAEVMIDTSAMTSNDLQGRIRELFTPASDDAAVTLTLSSFGFARGMPPLADLVFDMRFLDNPHWVPGLKEQTGQDAAVGEHITRDPAFADVFGRIRDLLLVLLPRYGAQGKPYVHVAFGCTGGRHRSVYTAEAMAESLRAAGFSPTVRHRNLGSRAADAIERDRR